MRGSWCGAALLLAAALAFTCLSTPAHALDQREVLMNVGAKPPATLGDATISLLHSLPRWDGAPNKLGRVDPSNDDDVDEAVKYAIGVVLPVAVAFVLALLTWLSCAGFCGGRACCNKCGTRTATRTYTARDQLWLKIAIVFLAAVSITLFVLGLISNAAFSASLDEAYLKCDALVEHLYKFHAPLKTMSLSTSDALAHVRTLNATVLAQLPADVSVYQACATLMFTTMELEQRLLAQIAPITGSGSAGSSSSGNTMDLGALAADLRALQAQLKQMPDLSGDRSALLAYKVSLDTHLPNPLLSEGVVPARRMADMQSRCASASATGARITAGLNPSLSNTGATIAPVQSGLDQYDSSQATSPAPEAFALRGELVADSTAPSVVSRVNALHDALAGLPDGAAFQSNLASFETQFAALSTETTWALGALAALRDDMAWFGDGSAYGNLLTQLRSGVPLVSHEPTLGQNLNRTGGHVFALDSRASTLALSLNASIAGVEDLRAGNNASSTGTGLGATILAVNTSLPRVQCIRPVFSQLLHLNQSVLVLPGRVDALLARRSAVLVQLQRLVRIQHDLTEAHQGLSNMSAALASFPNLTEVTLGAEALRTALGSFPDCVEAARELGEIDQGMGRLSDAYLASIQNGLGAFSSDAALSRPDVDALSAALQGLQAAVQSFPPSLAPWRTFASNISDLAASMSPNLAAVRSQVNAPDFATAGPPISDPLRTAFVQNLDAYVNLLNSAPDRAGLRGALRGLESNITATQGSEGNIASSLDRMQGAGEALPATAAVAAELERVYSATATTGTGALGTLLTGGPHSALNATIQSSPDFSAPASGVDATSAALRAQSGPLAALETNLASSTDFMDQADLESIREGLGAIGTLVENFPDLATPIGSLGVAASGLSSAEGNIADYRHEYYVARQSTVMFKNRIDWLRLLGFMLVLFVPLCVAACGLGAWWRRKPKPALYMGMCSFSIVAIFFVMTAVQLGPAMLFADQCVDLDGFLRTNLGSVAISATIASPWVNLTAPTDAGVLFDYFSTCAGGQPELLRVFQDPHKVLRENRIDFGGYRAQVSSSLDEGGNVVALRPAVWQIFDGLEEDVARVVGAANTSSALFGDCAASSAAWAPLRDSLCSSQGVSGSIALSTCICFLFGVCMVPGVCVGITGYKRFDPTNLAVTGEKVADPYAAGLAERAVHSPSGGGGYAGNGGGGGGGGGGGAGGLASPSQPLDVNGIELQERPVRRATFQMALASAPQRPDPEVVVSPSASTGAPFSPSRAVYSPTYGAAYGQQVQQQQQQPVYSPQQMQPQQAQQVVYAQPYAQPQPRYSNALSAQQSQPGQTLDPEVVVQQPQSQSQQPGLSRRSVSPAAATAPSAPVPMQSPTPAATEEPIVYEFE